jgi:hypothetical protein
LLILRPFLIFLNLIKIRLVYLDESRIGHLFGDALALLANNNLSDQFIVFPVKAPCSKFLIHKYNKKIKIVNSKILKLITAWLRNEPLIVINMTNSLNYVFEKDIFSREIVYKPRYLASEIDYRKIFSVRDEAEARNFILEKYKINKNKFCFYNLRSSSHDLNDNKNHQFRNLNSLDSHLLVECILSKNFYIINASDYFYKSEKVTNLREHSDFEIDDVIKAVLGCEFYVGDSTGTSVMAQIAQKPSFFYNIFPTNFELTNDLSEAVSVNVVHEDVKLDGNLINTWQISDQFRRNNVRLEAVPFRNYEPKFDNWLRRLERGHLD